ncbi:hypothetical protein H9X96_00055 [Pedobacter sp. N36a]|uniref:LiaF transmembrane domain-containing protein n=1 Tax=Pedobacter sp. N36a TaxID=2767996 RepID=UPI001656D8DA|nr:hypothetical protein [Pedobacter sp. N36a]MBC8984164.1 hypothetical protein [Pedobacter sp. N36a]
METQDKKHKFNFQLAAGAAIVSVGLIMLLNNLGLGIPHWVLSWHTIMLGIGLWIGYHKDFKVSGWLILVIIGGIYTLNDLPFLDLSGLKAGLVFIGLGIYMLIKPSSTYGCGSFSAKKPIQF